MPKITKCCVDALTPGKATRIHWDDRVKGFGVRVTASGSTAYVVQYRTRGSRRSRRATLGSSTLLSPDQARARALRALADAADGQDPFAKPAQAEPAVPRLREFAARYIEEHAQRTKKTWRSDQDYLERNRLLALLSVIFTQAIRWKVLPAGHLNPAADVSPYPERPRKRYLSIEELVRLGDALRSIEEESRVDDGQSQPELLNDRLDSIAIIRLAIFTGCRKSEIVTLPKDAIDREWGALRLGDSKTGPKEIALNSHALEILNEVEARRPDGDSPWVFPGRDPARPRGELRRIWNRARRLAGVPDVQMHDLRRTHASLAANANTPPAVLQGLLGHTRYATTERHYVQIFEGTRLNESQRIAKTSQRELWRDDRTHRSSPSATRVGAAVAEAGTQNHPNSSHDVPMQHQSGPKMIEPVFGSGRPEIVAHKRAFWDRGMADRSATRNRTFVGRADRDRPP